MMGRASEIATWRIHVFVRNIRLTRTVSTVVSEVSMYQISYWLIMSCNREPIRGWHLVQGWTTALCTRTRVAGTRVRILSVASATTRVCVLRLSPYLAPALVWQYLFFELICLWSVDDNMFVVPVDVSLHDESNACINFDVVRNNQVKRTSVTT